MASSARAYKNVLLPAACAILAGGLLNALMGMGNIAIKSPFFFDSIFTAACGAVFGPLAGALCGLATHLWLEALHGWDGLWIPFAVCNIATGLIVGFMARSRLSLVLNLLLCSFLVAMANAVLGGMVDFYFFKGVTTHPSDYLVTGLLLAGQSLISAAFWARIPLNLIDKGIAVSLAFLAKRCIDRRTPEGRHA